MACTATTSPACRCAPAAHARPASAASPARRPPALLGPRRCRPAAAPPVRAAAAAAAAPTDAASAAALGAFRLLPRQKQQQQQQEQEPSTATRTASTSTPPTATITRIFLTGAPPGVRSALTGGAAGRGGPRASAAHGPLSLLLVLLALAAAALAAVRRAVVRRVRGCATCRGYGVSRCRLCQGSGRVDWTAKLSHYDVCPLCMNRRFVSCGDCGGGAAAATRPLFAHLRRRAGGELFEGVPRPQEEQQQQQQQQGQQQQAGGVAAAAAGGGGDGGATTTPLVSPQGTRGPVLAFGGAGAGFSRVAAALASYSDGEESDGGGDDFGVARQPTGAASSRRRAQQIRDRGAARGAAFAVPADAAAPAGGVGSAMMD